MKIKEALNDGTLSLEDNIDYADMTEEEYKQEIERLNNNNQDMQKEMARTWKKYDELQGRINKAIEYIEKGLYRVDGTYVIKILKGEE